MRVYICVSKWNPQHIGQKYGEFHEIQYIAENPNANLYVKNSTGCEQFSPLGWICYPYIQPETNVYICLLNMELPGYSPQLVNIAIYNTLQRAGMPTLL